MALAREAISVAISNAQQSTASAAKSGDDVVSQCDQLQQDALLATAGACRGVWAHFIARVLHDTGRCVRSERAATCRHAMELFAAHVVAESAGRVRLQRLAQDSEDATRAVQAVYSSTTIQQASQQQKPRVLDVWRAHSQPVMAGFKELVARHPSATLSGMFVLVPPDCVPQLVVHGFRLPGECGSVWDARLELIAAARKRHAAALAAAGVPGASAQQASPAFGEYARKTVAAASAPPWPAHVRASALLPSDSSTFWSLSGAESAQNPASHLGDAGVPSDLAHVQAWAADVRARAGARALGSVPDNASEQPPWGPPLISGVRYVVLCRVLMSDDTVEPVPGEDQVWRVKDRAAILPEYFMPVTLQRTLALEPSRELSLPDLADGDESPAASVLRAGAAACTVLAGDALESPLPDMPGWARAATAEPARLRASASASWPQSGVKSAAQAQVRRAIAVSRAVQDAVASQAAEAIRSATEQPAWAPSIDIAKSDAKASYSHACRSMDAAVQRAAARAAAAAAQAAASAATPS